MAEELRMCHVLRMKAGNSRDRFAPFELGQSILRTLGIDEREHLLLDRRRGRLNRILRKTSSGRASVIGGTAGIRTKIEIYGGALLGSRTAAEKSKD